MKCACGLGQWFGVNRQVEEVTEGQRVGAGQLWIGLQWGVPPLSPQHPGIFLWGIIVNVDLLWYREMWLIIVMMIVSDLFGLYSGSSLLPWPPPLAWQSCFLCTCLGTASCCICRNVWAWQIIPLPNTATAVCIQEHYSCSKCVLYMVLITHFRLFFHNSTSITNVCHLRIVLSHWE